MSDQNAEYCILHSLLQYSGDHYGFVSCFGLVWASHGTKITSQADSTTQPVHDISLQNVSHFRIAMSDERNAKKCIDFEVDCRHSFGIA